MYFMNLIDFVISREQRKERYYFKKNTAYSPQIHLVAIVSIGKQTFWCSVPPCRNILGLWLFGVNSTARSEVCQLNMVLTKEDIFRFNVSVKDAISVHVVYRLDKLVHVVLYSVFRQVMPFPFYGIVHVHVHQLKHKGKSACWFIIQHFVKLNYLGMWT